jgi:predicted dinucleotide-binding enzyme
MTIGIIGAGNIGGTLATLLAAAGHDVLLSSGVGAEATTT